MTKGERDRERKLGGSSHKYLNRTSFFKIKCGDVGYRL